MSIVRHFQFPDHTEWQRNKESSSGTAAYMSPEQAKGKSVDRRSRHLVVRLRAVRNVDAQDGIQRRDRHRYARSGDSRRAGLVSGI